MKNTTTYATKSGNTVYVVTGKRTFDVGLRDAGRSDVVWSNGFPTEYLAEVLKQFGIES